MNSGKPHLQISICTCMRPVMLKACLESIAGLTFPINAGTAVAVIDNTAERSAEPIVAAFQKSFPVPLLYECEPRRGISMARNHALELARANHADHVIFIDDDEQTNRDWLVRLCDFAAATGWKHIIYGEVEPDLPPGTPAYLVPYFESEPVPTGKILKCCATNNVMIPMKIVRKSNLRFEERYALTGGSDTAFFLKAVEKGATIYRCREALVRESIPESKATLSWLRRRHFRNGIQSIEILELRVSAISTLRRAVSRFLRCGIAFLRGRNDRAAALWLKAWTSTGMLCGMAGIRIYEYRRIQGY